MKERDKLKIENHNCLVETKFNDEIEDRLGLGISFLEDYAFDGIHSRITISTVEVYFDSCSSRNDFIDQLAEVLASHKIKPAKSEDWDYRACITRHSIHVLDIKSIIRNQYLSYCEWITIRPTTKTRVDHYCARE